MSYSNQNRLHQALKELGRIYKSIFVLTYINDVEMRQDTEKDLNRIEQSHFFSNAVFYGHNKELKYALKEEQEMAISCRHLIQNSIVLFNYLELTKQLIDRKEDEEKYAEAIELIKNGSIMTWRHINIQGEYDFEPWKSVQDSMEIEKLIDFNI